MADLTDRLPLTQGTNRVIDDPAGPSALGAIANFVGSTFEGYQQIKSDVAKTNARKAAEEEKKTKNAIALDVSGAEDRALGVVTQSAAQKQEAQGQLDALAPDMTPDMSVFGLPNNVDPALRRDATEGGNRMNSLVDAVNQSKMPPITLEAAMSAEFRKMQEKYPDQMEHVIDMWKKTGLDVTLFRASKNYVDWEDYRRESEQNGLDEQRKFRQSIIEAGTKAMGPVAVGKTEEELYLHGLTVAQTDYTLDLNKRNLDARLAQATIDDKTKEAITKDSDQTIEQTLGVGMYNDLTPFISNIQQLGNLIAQNPNPENIAKFQQAGASVHQMLGNYVDHAVALAQSRGYKGDIGTFRNGLVARFKTVEELFSGDHSVVKTQIDSLNAIKTSLGIDTAQALPFFTALKSVGVQAEEIPSVMQAIQQNPEMSRKLSQEVKGFVTDFGQERTSTHLMNVVKILKGQATLRDMSGEEARKALTTLHPATIDLAKKYVRGQDGIDGDKVIHGVGELAIAARSIGPSSGATAMYIATVGYGGRSTRAALVKAFNDKNVDKDMVSATIQASTAASANMLQGIQLGIGKANASSPYHKIVWDDKSGKYTIDASGLQRAKIADRQRVAASIRSGSQFERFPRDFSKVEVPKEISRFVETANTNLENIVELNRVVPVGVQATDMQLREFFGRNTPLPNDGKQKEDVNVGQKITEMTNSLQSVIDKNLTSANTPVPVPAPKGLRGTIIAGESGPNGYDGIYGDVGNGSNSFGFAPPKPVSSMTIGEAIEFGRNVMIPATRGKVGAGDKGTSAVGAYQFTQGTLKEFGEKVFGSGWRNVVMTKENQDKLADAIIEVTGGDPTALVGRWPSLRGKL